MTAAVLIGLGMVAEMHAAAIAATDGAVTLHGVLGRDRAKAQAFADRHGVAVVYSDFDRLLADPGIDFAILATPPDARAGFAQALSAIGMPTLMEKPLERDLPRARNIVDTYRNANVPLGVVLQQRLRPEVAQVAGWVRDGALGDLASVELRVPWWRPQSYYDAPGRGSFERDGGGVLITQAIHAIDLMLELCGPVSEVQAITATSRLHRLEAEDFAAAGLVFASGAPGTLMASTTHFPGGGEELIMNGTQASAVLSATGARLHAQDGTTLTSGADGQSGGGADPMAFSHAWHQGVISDFAAAVEEARPPKIPGAAALPAQALIDAIQRSAREGRRVAVEVSHGQ
ncbi:MAG: Gfo/Idh/MocA family oxidoreductase [Pseudomonadota bacterium]